MSLSLLSLLSDGAFHSGQQLAEHLSISRTAVWKQIESLNGLGVTVETQRGKGYRWLGASPLLDASMINSDLSESLSLDCHCEVLASTASTNAALLKIAAKVPNAFTLVAESQSGGRGRRGRVWHSPMAQNLYVSTLLHINEGAAVLQGLSLVVGISLAETLNKHYDAGVLLKWPNDLLVDGKKLGGILVELRGDITDECSAVIGFGLNINMPDAGDTIDQPWLSLMQIKGQAVCRNTLLVQLLTALHQDLKHLSEHGWSIFAQRWKALDAFAGKQVTVAQGSEVIEGECLGVDHQGALWIQVNSEQRVFHGGEVSLRLM